MRLGYYAFVFFIGLSSKLFAQKSEILRGQVLYQNSFVMNQNVINASKETMTITDENGAFAIEVSLGDDLVFTAVNYELKVVEVTQEMLTNRRLVVNVEEKVTTLEEVVVRPENQEAFLSVENERFKGYEYEIDRGSKTQNVAMSKSVRGMQNGLNFVSIYRAMQKLLTSENESEEVMTVKLSEVLRTVYDPEFFILDLKLKPDEVEAFLSYCDAQELDPSLIKKENEFELIEYLVNQSVKFKSEIEL